MIYYCIFMMFMYCFGLGICLASYGQKKDVKYGMSDVLIQLTMMIVTGYLVYSNIGLVV